MVDTVISPENDDLERRRMRDDQLVAEEITYLESLWAVVCMLVILTLIWGLSAAGAITIATICGLGVLFVLLRWLGRSLIDRNVHRRFARRTRVAPKLGAS